MCELDLLVVAYDRPGPEWDVGRAASASLPFFGFSPVRRIAYEWVGRVAFRKIIDRYAPDIILEKQSEHVFVGEEAKRKGIQYVLEINGIPPLDLRLADCNVKELIRSERVLKRQIELADRIVLFDEGVGTELTKIYTNSGIWEKSIVLFNGVDVELFRAIDRTVARRRLQIEQPEKMMLYTGSFCPDHDMPRMVEVAEELARRDPAWVTYFIGPHQNHRETRHRSNSNGVIFAGPKDYREMPYWINAADIGLYFLRPEKQYALRTAMKLREYLGCGLPFCTNRCFCGVPGCFVCDYGNLFDDSVQAIDVVNAIYDMNLLEERRRIQSGVQKTRENYSYDVVAKMLKAEFKKIGGR